MAKVFKDEDKIYDEVPENKDGGKTHKKVITNEWAKSTYLRPKQARSMVILGGFEFYQDAMPILASNMAQSKGRKMISAETILKAEAYEDIMKEKIKEGRLKNIFKGKF